MVNILIFRTDRIGDLLVTCPAISTIKKYFKESNITLVASSKNYDYAKKLNIFDKVYQFPNTGILNRIFFIYKLYKSRFDYIFIFDGKERSILTSLIIRSKLKIALSPKIKSYYKLFKLKIYKDTINTNLNDIFQKMLTYCSINIKIDCYDFLRNKKNNNFSKLIPINNYLHIHLDEKWFNNLYIHSYAKINPTNHEFVNFLDDLLIDNNILITTGLIKLDLTEHLINKYLKKNTLNIYSHEKNNNYIYLVNKPSFDDLESLLRNTKTLVSCHGAITHAANSFNVRKIDILEKSKTDFYKRFTSYLNNYDMIYRSNFNSLKEEILKKI